MTLDEFKAWLDGFEESFKSNEDGICPDGRQYAKIKGKLKEINIPHSPSYGLNYPPNVREYIQQPLINPQKQPVYYGGVMTGSCTND